MPLRGHTEYLDSPDVQGEHSPSVLSRAAIWFHRIEIVFVVSMSVIVCWNVIRADQNMFGFGVIWGMACMAAAGVALWPRTSRGVHFVAEAVLLMAALGEVIGPQHNLLTFMNREIRDATRWNEIPLTQRRIIVWNIISAFGLIWGIPAVGFLLAIAQHARRRPFGAIGYLLLFIGVWGSMGFTLLLVVRAFFRG